nr:MAG TPA: hypothetical protein [Caudoviricetes sp.]
MFRFLNYNTNMQRVICNPKIIQLISKNLNGILLKKRKSSGSGQ